MNKKAYLKLNNGFKTPYFIKAAKFDKFNLS